MPLGMALLLGMLLLPQQCPCRPAPFYPSETACFQDPPAPWDPSAPPGICLIPGPPASWDPSAPGICLLLGPLCSLGLPPGSLCPPGIRLLLGPP